MSDADVLAALDAADAALVVAHQAIDTARHLVEDGGGGGDSVRYPKAVTDFVVRDKPPLPTLSGAGFLYDDPVYGSRILRVTDPATAEGRSCRVASNAHLACWSADNAAFFVVSDAGIFVYHFDAGTFAATRAAHLPGWLMLLARARRAGHRPHVRLSEYAPVASPYSQGEPCWSRTDPDALYTVGGSQTRTIRRWSLASNTFTDVLDLDTLVPAIANEPRTYVGGLITGGGDSVLIFFGGAGQDQHYLATVLRPGDAAPFVLNTREQLGISLHSATIDLTGRYVMLFSTEGDIDAGRPKQIVWDTSVAPEDPAAFIPLTVCPWGHDAGGFGLWVNMDTSGAQPYDARQWQLRSLADVNTTKDLINPQPMPSETYIADHTTWNCDRDGDPQPVISALYRDDNPTRPVPPWNTWDDEIIAIATDGSGTAFRFAHHRSNIRNEANPEQLDFWSQPMPNVSPDGNYVIFTSNMERTLGRESSGALRQDVFVVALR